MKHGRGRYLGAEPEALGGFRAMNLDRLAIAAGDGLDHLEDVGKDGADEPAGPRDRRRARSSRWVRPAG